MKTSTRIKQVIGYLRGLTAEEFHWSKNDNVMEKLVTMGARRVGSGAYSYCYELDGFVIKISSENFNPLRSFRNNKFFKRFTPPVYWIHQTGMALICKFVEFITLDYDRHNFIRKRFKRLLKQASLGNWDLHPNNLVRLKESRRYMVIDYGCLLRDL